MGLNARLLSRVLLVLALFCAVGVVLYVRQPESRQPAPDAAPAAVVDANGSGAPVAPVADTRSRLVGLWEMDWARFGTLRGDATEAEDPNVSIFDGVALMFLHLDDDGVFRAEHVRYDGNMTVFEGTWSADNRGNAGGPTMTTVFPDGLAMRYDVEWTPALTLVGPIGANAIRPRLPLQPYDAGSYPTDLDLDRLCDHGPIAMRPSGEGVAFDLSAGSPVAPSTVRPAYLGGLLAAWGTGADHRELQLVGLDACGIWLRLNSGSQGSTAAQGDTFVVPPSADRRYRIGGPDENPLLLVIPWMNDVFEVRTLRELDDVSVVSIERLAATGR